jgi:hypothetical protein
MFAEFIDFVSLFCDCAGVYKEGGLGMVLMQLDIC